MHYLFPNRAKAWWQRCRTNSASARSGTIGSMKYDHTLLYEIRATFQVAGCPICGLAERTLRRYLSALTHEGVTDRQQRAVIRAAYGFCPSHARVLRESRNALGSALIHRDLLSTLNKALAEEKPRAKLRLRILGRGEQPLPANGGCVACAQVREAEQRYSSAFGAALADPEALQQFQRSSGLCVPHLRLALSHAGVAEYELIRSSQSIIWGNLIAELDEFIRKQDHNFRHEPSGTEADSWKRAIDLVAGRAESVGTRRDE